jgi:putative transcriptional regulator
MAIVRCSLKRARAKARVDRKKLDVTTEEDIHRQKIEDCEDPANDQRTFALVMTPKQIREKLGMTQEQFAEALRIPLATLRNWEQGRVLPDPASRSLLNIVAKAPKAALGALRAG